MRLQRLRLRQVRGITEREVTFADVGVTVVEGPNEAGKSTMIEALDLLLHVRADSKSAKVRAIMPSGADVGSEIEADIACGAWQFTYFKRFNKQAATELTITAPRREQLTGRDAHERVLQILDENVDVGLMRALRLMQGDDPALSDLAASSTLTTALDLAAGSVDDDGGGGEDPALIEAVKAEYARYFTPGHGRPTGELAQLRRAYDDAVARHTELQAGLDAVESEAGRLGTEIERRAELQRAQELNKVARAELQEELHEASVAKARVATAQQEVRSADAVARLARRDADDRAEMRAQLADLAKESEAAAARIDTAKQQSVAARADALELGTELQGARTKLTQVRAELHRAHAEVARHTQRTELARVSDVLHRLNQVEEQMARADTQLAGNGVDAAVAAAAARLGRELAAAEAAVTAAAATFTVTPGAGPAVHVDGEALVEVAEFEARDESVVDVQGVVRVSIRRSSDADALAEKADALRADAAQLCTQHELTGLDEFASRATQRTELQHHARSLRERHAQLVGTATREALQQSRDDLVAALGDSAAADVGDPDVDEAAPSVTELSARERELADLVAKAEGAAARMRSQEESARERAEAAMADGRRANERAEQVRQRLTARQAELSDADAEAAAARAEQQRSTAQTELTVASAALTALDLADLDQRCDRIDRRASDLSEALGVAEQAITESRTRIEMYRDDSRLDAVQEAAAEVTAADVALRRVTRRAEAAALLLSTLSSKRQEARARYVAPFTQRLERLGAPVFGESVRFDVDDDLSVRSRTVDGVTVPHDALSGGAREQVGLIARLACAMLVDPADGVPVIIDDALGYSDPDRLAAMADVLAQAGQDAQVIVLTCTPQRYAAVEGASTVAV